MEDKDLHYTLGEIKGIVGEIKDDVVEIKKNTGKHDDRIRSLEKSRSWLTGIGSLCVLIIGASSAFLWKLIGGNGGHMP